MRDSALTAPDYTFEVPGRHVSIRLSAEAARRILAEGVRGLGLMRRRGVEVGGILCGSIEAGERTIIRVEQTVPVPCEYAFGPSYVLSGNDRQAFRRALVQARAVGFYRSDTRDSGAATDADLALLREMFGAAESVALILKPRILETSLARCCVQHGGRFSDTNDVGFRPEPRISGPGNGAGAPPPRGAAAPVEVPEAGEAPPEEVPLPSFLCVPPPRRILPRWHSWWIQAPLLMALLGAAGMLGYLAAARFPFERASVAAAGDPYSFSLAAVQEGRTLMLTWNRGARAVVSARRGVLAIADGGVTRTIELTPLQLREGAFRFEGDTDDLQVRLELFLNDRASVVEVWRPAAENTR